MTMIRDNLAILSNTRVIAVPWNRSQSIIIESVAITRRLLPARYRIEFSFSLSLSLSPQALVLSACEYRITGATNNRYEEFNLTKRITAR